MFSISFKGLSVAKNCFRPKYIVDFNEESEKINSFFDKVLFFNPTQNCFNIWFNILTEKLSSSCHFSKKEILKSLNNLDLNSTHEHDRIKVFICYMSEVSKFSALRPLRYVCVWLSFWENGKKNNIVPIYKRATKLSIKYYCPVSLFPIYRKIWIISLKRNGWFLLNK